MGFSCSARDSNKNPFAKFKDGRSFEGGRLLNNFTFTVGAFEGGCLFEGCAYLKHYGIALGNLAKGHTLSIRTCALGGKEGYLLKVGKLALQSKRQGGQILLISSIIFIASMCS